MRHPLPLLLIAGLSLGGGCGDDTGPEVGCPAGLAAGSLVITEIMANVAGSDTGGEWIEIFNPADREVSLRRVRLSASRGDGSSERSHVISSAEIPAGGYLVLGNILDTIRPAHVGYGYGDDLQELPNEGGRLRIYCGDQVVDEVIYGAAAEGRSRCLPGAPDAQANDDLAAWRDSRGRFDQQLFGSPGQANDCDAVTCRSPEGELRKAESPAAGDLVVSEIMADPDKVGDAEGEWFEVHVKRSVHLNDLLLGQKADGSDLKAVADLARLDCVAAEAGSHVVFARSRDPAVNGGIDPASAQVFVFGSSLPVSGTLTLGMSGAVHDRVSWTSASKGVALALGPASLDVTANDDPAAWCKAVDPYGKGDKGTPGGANRSCGPRPGHCMNGVDEVPKKTPGVGDLVITEIMADPAKAADADGEWFEVMATKEVDLNGLMVGPDLAGHPFVVAEGACLRVPKDGYVLFAASGDPLKNGGLPTLRPELVFSVSLSNTNGKLALGVPAPAGDMGVSTTVIDAVTWSSSSPGASRSLLPGKLNAVDNDDPKSWCLSAEAYGGGDRGTPGTPHKRCQ